MDTEGVEGPRIVVTAPGGAGVGEVRRESKTGMGSRESRVSKAGMGRGKGAAKKGAVGGKKRAAAAEGEKSGTKEEEEEEEEEGKVQTRTSRGRLVKRPKIRWDEMR